jgi:peroxiredoxin Q/BCP
VVGVSADKPETSASFRESLDLPYPLVGDPKGDILRAYKVRWPLVGLAQRVSHVIGRDHRIESAYHSEMNAKAHVVRALEEAAGG